MKTGKKSCAADSMHAFTLLAIALAKGAAATESPARKSKVATSKELAQKTQPSRFEAHTARLFLASTLLAL